MLGLLFALLSAAPIQLSVAPGSKIFIEGDSSVHAWKCEATKFDGAGEATSSDQVPGSVSVFELGIPIKDIRCGNDSMDGNLREALKADKFPRVDFTFTSAALLPGEATGPQKFKLSGTLSVAGVEKPITTVITVSSAPGNVFTATALVPLKMTGFGIGPPTAMLGIMKTADAISIRIALKVLAQFAVPAPHASK